MAEAHQAVAFQFAITDEGISLHFDKAAVKTALLSFFGTYRRRLFRIRTAISRGIFPASPLSLVVIFALVTLLSFAGYDTTYGVLPRIIDISRLVKYLCLAPSKLLCVFAPSILLNNLLKIYIPSVASWCVCVCKFARLFCLHW